MMIYLTSVHGLRLHIPKPDSQVWGKALSGELEHSNVPATVEMESVNHRNWSDWVPHRPHALVEGVLHLVRGDDRPAGPVIQHLFVGLLGTGRGLEENNLESIIC